MTQYSHQDKTLALVGIYQVAQQVYQLATTGNTDENAFHASINSLFCENPTDTLDVFGGNINHLQQGIHALLAQMKSGQVDAQRNIELTKYVLSLMILEKNVSKTEGALGKVSQVIESARIQRGHFGDFHENVIATLARAYSENISTLNPRIMVNGQHGHLQNPKTANKIRALLLAGIRAAILWRQVGGSRWGLIWHRKRYLQTAQALSRPISTAKEATRENIEKPHSTDHE